MKTWLAVRTAREQEMNILIIGVSQGTLHSRTKLLFRNKLPQPSFAVITNMKLRTATDETIVDLYSPAKQQKPQT